MSGLSPIARAHVLIVPMAIVLSSFAASASRAAGLLDEFMDPTDGQLDIGNWLLTKRGFLLNPIVITEPSIGYGGGAAILFFHGNEPSEGAASAEGDKASAAAATSRPKPPSVSFLLGAGTETDTWIAGGGHFGSFLADRLRYVGAVGYASVNIDFYIGDTGIEYNMEAPFILQELQVRLSESNWFLGGRYLYSTLESEFHSRLFDVRHEWHRSDSAFR